MKKVITLAFISVILFCLVANRFERSSAALNDARSDTLHFNAATLDLNTNDGLNLVNIGLVKPGDTGIIEIRVINTGNIPGSVSLQPGVPQPPFTVSTGVLKADVNPGETVALSLDWQVPLQASGSGIDGLPISFTCTVIIENGYKVAKQVLIAGQFSDVLTPTATIPAPSAPDALQVQDPHTGTQLDLAWQPPANYMTALAVRAGRLGNPLSYRIYRGTTPGGPYTLVAASSATSFSDTGLAADKRYYYVVTALNAEGLESEYSAEANGQPIGPEETVTPSPTPIRVISETETLEPTQTETVTLEPSFTPTASTSPEATATATNEPEPSASIAPTATPTVTPEPPTVTPLPPTATREPPTATYEPPTATAEPPTATSEPPTATPEPPTATPELPTATDSPAPTATESALQIIPRAACL